MEKMKALLRALLSLGLRSWNHKTDSKPDRAGYQILVSDILDDHISGMINR